MFGTFGHARSSAYPNPLDPAGSREKSGMGSGLSWLGGHTCACNNGIPHAGKSGHQCSGHRRGVRSTAYLMDRLLGHRLVSRHSRNRSLRDH